MNRRVLGLITIVIFIVVGLVACSADQKVDKEPASIEEEKAIETNHVEEEIIEDEVDPLATTKEAITYQYRINIPPSGSGEEYPKDQTETLKAELLALAKDGQYGEILDKADEVTEEYLFSEEENLDIAGIIYDASLVAGIFQSEEAPLKYGETVAESTTPEMLVTSTLYSDNFQRRPVIEDLDSLGPIGFSEVDMGERRMFRNAKQAENELLYSDENKVASIFSLHDDANAVYAFDLTLRPNDGGLPITAYVWEDLYGKLHFYGMYAPDDVETYEQTISWWMDQDILYEQAEKKQEEYYEENGENGVITEEQIDQLFESGW